MFLSCFKKFLFIHKINLICIVFCLGVSNLVQAQIKPLTISGEGYQRRELHKKQFSKSLKEVRKIANDSRKNKFIFRNWNLNIKDSIIFLQLFPNDEESLKFGDTIFKHRYQINEVETILSKDGRERYDWYTAKNLCTKCSEEIAILRYELLEASSGFIIIVRYNQRQNPELVRLDYE
jgi:hypothetical protein